MNGRSWRTRTVIASVAVAALLAAPVSAVAKGPGGGGGGEPEETAGNNLSFPVEWSEVGYTVTVPGTMETASIAGTVLPGTFSMEDLTPCLGAIQKDAQNVWQAENALVTPNQVTLVDWGDNLEAKDWRVGQVIRVETGLYDEALAAPMTKYEMCYISGSGTTEVWGLRVADNGDGTYTPVTTESTVAMVYTAGARLTIQRVDPTKALAWDAATHQWVGEGALAAPIINLAAYERTTDGPGSYGAELNVQGKIVYGYVWTSKGITAGEYRITFSVDQPTFFTPGVSLAGATVGVAEANQAYVDGANELTYLDVGMTGKTSGGRK